jgi:hypothetical protein
MRWAARWCGLGLCVWLSVWASAASAGGWEELLREDGVVVSGREVEGRSLPTFRGQGVVEGHLLEVLAVLSDTPRNAEWMHQCQESRMLKQISEFERIIYNRTTAPWPVADRDVVLRSRAEVPSPGRGSTPATPSTCGGGRRGRCRLAAAVSPSLYPWSNRFLQGRPSPGRGFHPGHPLHAVEGGVGVEDTFGVCLPLLVSAVEQVLARPPPRPCPADGRSMAQAGM